MIRLFLAGLLVAAAVGVARAQETLKLFILAGDESMLPLGSIDGTRPFEPTPKRADTAFDGQVTQNIIHRRARLTANNSGGISIKGALRDVVVEGCTAGIADSRIRVEKSAAGVLIRHCRSATGEMPSEGAAQVP